MPSSLATWAMLPPAASTSSTASALNSGVNFRRLLVDMTDSFRARRRNHQVSVKPGQHQMLWGLMTAAFVVLLVWVWLIKPRAMRGRPWRLARVDPERGRTTTLVLSPPGGERFRFDPGQFAWFAFDRSPYSLTLHPFSFSSSTESDEVEIAVKALGDFTSRVHELDVGTAVYVDGPHGVFSMDQDEGPWLRLHRRWRGHRWIAQHAAHHGRPQRRPARRPRLRERRLGRRRVPRRARTA